MEKIIKLSGKIDSNNVTQVEEKINNEIKDFDGELIFDASELEYISSAGLRMILKFKKQNDNTKVINCSNEIYEIFSMTGFTQMMEIQKSFRNISVENSEKLGEGFYGTIYRLDPETIVKVYKIPDSLEMIKREISLARKAFVMGIPTAIPYDIVKVGDLYGAIFELLNAKPIVSLISNDDELDDLAKKSTAILKQMHSTKVENGELPSRKNVVINLLKECEKYFSKETFDRLIKLLENVPEVDTLLHCDFHVKNIMMQDDELLLIDMDTLSTGHPLFELGAIYATYLGYSCVDKLNTDKFLGMPLETTTHLFNKTLDYYFEGKSEKEIDEIKEKLSVIAYIQVLYLRTKCTPDSYEFKEAEIDFCVKYLDNISQKLDSLIW